MKNFKQYLKDGLDDVRKANREKVTALKKANKDKEAEVRRTEMEKEQEKNSAEREKAAEKTKDKKESLVQKVMEYIKSDGARRKCAGGDGRRTENHDCDKVHSGMSHDEWKASQDTPKDEAAGVKKEYSADDQRRLKRWDKNVGKKKKNEIAGDKEAYKKFFDAKLKKYGVSSPADLKGDDKKKFYDEIDAEWEGDNEED